MRRVGAPLRPLWNGGTRGGGSGRRPRAATALAVAVLALSCARAPAGDPLAGSPARIRAAVETGLDLYASREFGMAARRFGEAADAASEIGDSELARRATAAECASWLRAQQLAALSDCTERLESLQRRARQSDPGVNTLVALGALSAGRPLPPLRIPEPVHAVLQEAAKESAR